MPQALAFIAPAIFGAGGSAALFAVTAAGTLQLTTLGIAANIVGSLALNAVAGRQRQPNLPERSPESLMVTTAQDTADRVVHFGRARLGGALAFINARGGVLSQVIAHGQGEFDAIEALLIDRNPVTVDAQGYVTQAKYQHAGAPLVRIVSRMGVVPQPYFAELGATYIEWTPDHRLDGVACTLMQAQLPPASEWQRVYPDREPKLEVIARAAVLRDPRDGARRWSENAALCALAFEESPDGGGLAGLIDEATFAQAADICDEAVPLAEGGTEPRYRFAGSYTLQEQPAEVRNRLLGAMAGQYWITPAGKLGLRAGAYAPPRFTITQDMVREFDWRAGLSATAGYNVQRFEYIDPALQFARVAGDPWVNADSVAAFGERAVAPFMSTPSHRQCRAVAKIQDMIENPPQEITLPCKPVAQLCLYEPTVRLDLPDFGIDGDWRIKDFDIDTRTCAPTYRLARIDAGAYQQTLAEQGVRPTFVDIAGSDGIPAPQGFNAAPIGVQIAGGSYVAGLGAAWSARPFTSLSPLLEYAPAGSGEWVAVTVAPDATSAQISGGVQDGAAYDVRLRWRAPGEALGPEAREDGVIAQAVTGAPAVPSGLAVTQGSAGVALVQWTASATAGHYQSQLYRGGVLVASVVSERSTPQTVSDICGPGVFSWQVRAVNVSGVASELSAAVTRTIS